MAFLAAMNNQATPTTKTGVNGEEVLTEAGVGDVRVSLFAMLTRDLARPFNREGKALDLSASYISSQIASAPEAYLEDLLVMAMQTRDIRGEKENVSSSM